MIGGEIITLRAAILAVFGALLGCLRLERCLSGAEEFALGSLGEQGCGVSAFCGGAGNFMESFHPGLRGCGLGLPGLLHGALGHLAERGHGPKRRCYGRGGEWNGAFGVLIVGGDIHRSRGRPSWIDRGFKRRHISRFGIRVAEPAVDGDSAGSEHHANKADSHDDSEHKSPLHDIICLVGRRCFCLVGRRCFDRRIKPGTSVIIEG